MDLLSYLIVCGACFISPHTLLIYLEEDYVKIYSTTPPFSAFFKYDIFSKQDTVGAEVERMGQTSLCHVFSLSLNYVHVQCTIANPFLHIC